MSHYELTELEVPVGDYRVICSLATPVQVANDPALLVAAGANREGVIGADSCYRIVQTFVNEGHRALSFDPPNHGQFENEHGSGLVGMAGAFAAGEDPFAEFVANGRGVIDHCVHAGMVRPDRVFAFGRSRGGYCALRLMAAERRVQGVVAISPVTDWRILAEFRALAARPETGALALHNFVSALAGRPVYVAIGNNDERVGTLQCVDFGRALMAADPAAGEAAGRVELHVAAEGGHMLSDDWGDAGGRYLLARQAEDGAA